MALIAKYIARHRLRETRLLDTIADFLVKKGEYLDSKVRHDVVLDHFHTTGGILHISHEQCIVHVIIQHLFLSPGDPKACFPIQSYELSACQRSSVFLKAGDGAGVKSFELSAGHR